MTMNRVKITESGEGAYGHPLYDVENTRQNEYLGCIQYWPDWKRYVFFFFFQTFYSPECLIEISAFLFNLNIPTVKKPYVPKHVKPLEV